MIINLSDESLHEQSILNFNSITQQKCPMVCSFYYVTCYEWMGPVDEIS